MTSERMPLKEAAARLGISPQYLRDLMSDGKLDIGLVVRHKPNRYGAVKNNYIIFKKKLEKVVGYENL